MLSSQFGENVNKNFQKTVQQQIRFINSKEFRLLEEMEDANGNHMIRPVAILLTSPMWSNIISRVKLFDETAERQFGQRFDLRGFAQSFRRIITDYKDPDAIRFITAFLVFVDFMLNRDIGNSGRESNLRARSRIATELAKLGERQYAVEAVFEYLTGAFAFSIDKDWGLSETARFLNKLPGLRLFGKEGVDFYRRDIGKYNNRKIQFRLPYNNRTSAFLIDYLSATTNQSLSYSVEWEGVSSGHKAYLNLFANFYAIRSQLKGKLVLVSIDEGDLYFHPKWQTEFLYKLVNILPRLLDKPCQLFLTTHSPFLVSDLPKDNLIFVDRNEENELTIIPLGEIKGATFGGNIGELYLDAFFMKGSLVSQFAAEKIRGLIKRARNRTIKTSQSDRNLISKIGDDLIRLQLEKLTNDKN